MAEPDLHTKPTVAVLEQTARVLAGLTRPSLHSQLCPVWKHKRPIGECDCWILQEARVGAGALATAAPFLIAEGADHA